MPASGVSVALVERLGEKGANALLDVIEANNRMCVEQVLERSGDRFERRLVDETAKMRVEMARLRTEIVSSRFEMLKWNFIFWVGQVVTLAGIVGLLLRTR